MSDHHRHIHSYVLRGGRVSKLQQRAIEKLTSKYCIPFSESSLDLRQIFGDKPVFVEIGFGNGDATIDIAQTYPDRGFIGVEVFPAGIGNVLYEVNARDLYNVRIIRHDAIAVFRHMLPSASLTGIHLFFPDPWPKKRHHKRRIIQPDIVSLMTSRLKANGYFYAVTDWADYAEWMLEILDNEPGLKNLHDGFAPRSSWRPVTRFERKAYEKGHEIYELYFAKSRQSQ